MANITVRNIPDDMFRIIKRLSSIEKRSVNSELLVIIERGVHSEVDDVLHKTKHIPASIQINLWRNLSDRWTDRRSREDIVADIYGSRTTGREFKL